MASELVEWLESQAGLDDRYQQAADEIERLQRVVRELRTLYFPNCKSYPTRTFMSSLEDDPDHGCDCKSCQMGRLLFSVLGTEMWEKT